MDSDELENLRSKNSTTNISSMTRVPPKAFTEKGLYMLATILKGPAATQTTTATTEVKLVGAASARKAGQMKRPPGWAAGEML